MTKRDEGDGARARNLHDALDPSGSPSLADGRPGVGLDADRATDFVDHVVPLLRERRLIRDEYTNGTLRDHLGLERPRSRCAPVTVRVG